MERLDLGQNKTNKGCIPIQILEMSDDRTMGIIKEFYTTKEMSVTTGDEIKKIKCLNGWACAKNIKTEDQGWIPDEVIE